MVTEDEGKIIQEALDKKEIENLKLKILDIEGEVIVQSNLKKKAMNDYETVKIKYNHLSDLYDVLLEKVLDKI